MGLLLFGILAVLSGQTAGEETPPAAPAVEASPEGVEAADAGPKNETTANEKDGRPDWWKKVPRAEVFPKPGFFQNPPAKGTGYYTGIDWLRGIEREALPPSPWPAISPIFQSLFELDYRKVDPPGEDRSFPLLDELKRIPLGDNWLMATGGDVRYRYMNENNSRLRPVLNDYDLFRARVFTDFWHHDDFRIYAEFITAEIWNNSLAPVLPDKDPADFLNLFAEMKLLDWDSAPAVLRFGRQELLFGSQRLISTLDWANTRRTFQGARLLHHTEQDSVDFFWVQPVVPDPEGWGWAETSCNFAGWWWTHRFDKDNAADLYALWYSNKKLFVEEGGTPLVRGNFATLGSRTVGNHNDWLHDAEVALQLGTIYDDKPLTAGMATVGLGRRFADLPMSPTAWVYYDYASGSDQFRQGPNNTFQQLFPFGHYYLGWTDLVGRQNIRSVSQQMHLYPTKWITLTVQHYNFWLASAGDALYFANGQPGRLNRRGAAGFYVGDEWDFTVNFHLGPRTDVLAGYCTLNGGDFLRNTGKVSDSSLGFAQISFKY
jgi:hypothetical protein